MIIPTFSFEDHLDLRSSGLSANTALSAIVSPLVV